MWIQHPEIEISKNKNQLKSNSITKVVIVVDDFIVKCTR
jgi:hypothetical protein